MEDTNADLSPRPAEPHPAADLSRRFSIEEVGFFEGTEKLLEVWFDIPSPESESRGLRDIPMSFWQVLLDLAKCHVLSKCNNEKLDAYVLSESSMFISRNRFILKTCGTTSLLSTVKPLLKTVKKFYPRSEVKDFFYSHSPFMKPDLQLHPHHSFNDESTYLDTIFPDGAAYVLGRINGKCWYLYLVESIENPLQDPDQTLEILMTEFDSELIGRFSKLSYESAEDLNKSTGLNDLIPGATIDSYIFEPCGFSLNAIVKEDMYFTIHVTPQEECAYVSFETNVVGECYKSLINKVLDIFKPGSFTLTLFANKAAKCNFSHSADHDGALSNYTCLDKQISLFSIYNLTFLHYKHNSLYNHNNK
ncbi:PREDICTED: S-adenosylmethionine decarboxylase proenzyme-like [Amphimedon queenslandica]|uniref:S-adenosylmethionine decarboxylase proenzyme n=1 Tax=Amphimedon queenslandica TaxID=400682 RepID=A0A1X7V9R0_AMPQE|nr:PREDICTED: S-adenosylmethionine decarboxylase proenzyme-like [Amphimedon queenslandica]|eukprot:XP_011402818.1 PREDICTED: S-adenosylmethionine decarboxylase proenzyme-like [Amphimedon queenslandica]